MQRIRQMTARMTARMRSWSPVLRWSVLSVLSLAFAVPLHWLGLPAAPLLGPMAASVVLAAKGEVVRVPRAAFLCAQGAVGVMIASHLPASIFAEIAARWPIFIMGTLSTLLISAVLGWLLTRARILPGTTAIWGSAPGAATVMTLMSEAYGADLRLVAFMQYLRVACCAAVAACIGRLAGIPAAPAVALPPPLPWSMIVPAVCIAAGGAFLGHRLRIPGGALLLPMGAAIAVKMAGHWPVELPHAVLAAAYILLGWSIGMRFTPDVLSHAARAFPHVLASIFGLMAACGVFAAGLAFLTGIDPLTAYLATSPGGADSVSIIASATKVDISFVVAMQIARFFCVLVTGPALARFMSRLAEGREK